jgi:alcohol dehydrogenase
MKMALMKAAVRTGLMGSTLKYTTEHPQPMLSDTNEKGARLILVKVNASAINPVDYKVPRAVIGAVYGIDMCGTVQQVGSDVKEFQAGDVVFGKADTGSLAEYAIASADCVARKDPNWTPAQAAAVPVVYQTSLQALKIGGILSDGDNTEKTILVIGASGGCGLASVQLAKAMGVSRIIGICSGKNAEFVKQAGATEIVDYTDATAMQTFLSENTGKMDCVYDAATGSGHAEDYVKQSMPLLKAETGEYVAINGSPSMWIRHLAGKMKPHQHLLLGKHSTQDLETIVSLLNKTGDRPHVNTFDFTDEDVHAGFDLLKSRRTRGKIVFEMH